MPTGDRKPEDSQQVACDLLRELEELAVKPIVEWMQRGNHVHLFKVAGPRVPVAGTRNTVARYCWMGELCQVEHRIEEFESVVTTPHRSAVGLTASGWWDGMSVFDSSVERSYERRRVVHEKPYRARISPLFVGGWRLAEMDFEQEEDAWTALETLLRQEGWTLISLKPLGT